MQEILSWICVVLPFVPLFISVIISHYIEQMAEKISGKEKEKYISASIIPLIISAVYEIITAVSLINIIKKGYSLYLPMIILSISAILLHLIIFKFLSLSVKTKNII